MVLGPRYTSDDVSLRRNRVCLIINNKREILILDGLTKSSQIRWIGVRLLNKKHIINPGLETIFLLKGSCVVIM